MDIIGKWKIHSHLTLDDEAGMVYKTLDELAARDPEDDSAEQMKGYVIEITEDGSIITTMPVPADATAEQIEQAKERGLEIIDDKLIVLERHSWREKDGVLQFNSGIKGTILDETVDPWVPLEFDEEGMLKMLFMRLERID